MTISDLENNPGLILITNSQDVAPINADFGTDFDGFLASVDDGDYGEVWGFYGIVPSLRKPVEKVN